MRGRRKEEVPMIVYGKQNISGMQPNTFASLASQPVGTFEEEKKRFQTSRAAEGMKYDSNAEVYEEFKAYYDKKLKVASEAGTAVWAD